jgi:hypothetical protein
MCQAADSRIPGDGCYVDEGCYETGKLRKGEGEKGGRGERGKGRNGETEKVFALRNSEVLCETLRN